jgi:DNA-binding MarR family transcriptional regulator
VTLDPDSRQPVAPPLSPTMIMVLQGRAVEARVESELRQFGLSLRRFGILGHLRREPGISFSALARRAGMKVQSLHPVIDALIVEGYVATLGGVGQGRAAVIELTERGTEALEQAAETIRGLDLELFSGPLPQRVAESLVQWGEEIMREQLKAARSAE